MKALTIWQPWASAMFTPLKRFETRSWAPPSSLLGKRLAIHAAKQDNAALRAYWDRLPQEEKNILAAIGIAGYADMPRGCIVGTGMLSQIHKTENITGFLEPWELKWGEYESGRYAWELSDLDLFKSPVKCTGRQGLFNVDLESSVVTGSQQHFLF
jgi:hypothetical protein